MKLTVGVEFAAIKAGVEARSPELRLCGHGASKMEAIDSLKHGIQIWTNGLMLADPQLLADTLTNAGVVWARDGETVEIAVEEV